MPNDSIFAVRHGESYGELCGRNLSPHELSVVEAAGCLALMHAAAVYRCHTAGDRRDAVRTGVQGASVPAGI